MVARYPLFSNDTMRMRDAVDRLFGEPMFRAVGVSARQAGSSLLPVDVFGTDQDIFVFASAPGVDPSALEISIDENVLTIAGSISNVAKSTEAEGATWFLHEMPHGEFRRTLTLPVDVDADGVEATFENGILRLRLPKAEAAKPRQIKVRAGQPIEVQPAIEETVEA
jgi:HSP20 family protein